MLTIVWDVDDVLNDFMRLWLEDWWLVSHINCTVRYENLKKNPPNRILGISLDEYHESIDSFRLSGIYEKMQPVDETVVWFEKYGKNYRHIALTSVSLIASLYSASWVYKHFGKWIRSFHVVPSRRKGQKIPKYETTKTDYLKWLNKADFIIDDNETNISSAKKIGIKGMLFPRPWNNAMSSISESLETLTRCLKKD